MLDSELILSVDGLDETVVIECDDCCNEEQPDCSSKRETGKKVPSLRQMHEVMKQAHKAQLLLEAAMDNLAMLLKGYEKQDKRHESCAYSTLHAGKGKSNQRKGDIAKDNIPSLTGNKSRSTFMCLVEGSKHKKGKRQRSRSHSRGYSRSHSRGHSRSHSRRHSRYHPRRRSLFEHSQDDDCTKFFHGRHRKHRSQSRSRRHPKQLDRVGLHCSRYYSNAHEGSLHRCPFMLEGMHSHNCSRFIKYDRHGCHLSRSHSRGSHESSHSCKRRDSRLGSRCGSRSGSRNASRRHAHGASRSFKRRDSRSGSRCDFRHGSRDVSRDVSRRVSRDASRRVSRDASRRGSRSGCRDASRRVSRDASRRGSRSGCRDTSRRVSRDVSRRVSRDASRRVSRDVSRRGSRSGSRDVSRRFSRDASRVSHDASLEKEKAP